jgi:hypothetical protein
MPQISLYIDKDTLLKIEKAAKQENISLSKWVGKNIKKAIQEQYPPKYFELFGAIVDEPFTVPKLTFKEDRKREQF